MKGRPEKLILEGQISPIWLNLKKKKKVILWISEGYRSWGRKFSMVQQEWNDNKTTIVWNEGNKLKSSKTLHETEIYPIET